MCCRIILICSQDDVLTYSSKLRKWSVVIEEDVVMVDVLDPPAVRNTPVDKSEPQQVRASILCLLLIDLFRL
jgi:hypothetical protein